jgi:hypothetical protein
MKTCFKCGTEKPLEEFYTHPRMADGHLNKCKECTKRDVRVDRQTNPRSREYDRRRYRDNPERKRILIEKAREARLLNPIKYRARTALGNAVRSGRIAKPTTCSVCGCTPRKLEGHHPDYLKPLEVVWCCTTCHRVLDGVTIQDSVATSQQVSVSSDLPIV